MVTFAAVLGAGESDFTPHRRNSNCSDRGLSLRALRGPVLSRAHYTPHHQVPQGPCEAALLSFSEKLQTCLRLHSRSVAELLTPRPDCPKEQGPCRACPRATSGDPSPSKSARLFQGRLCATTACCHCQGAALHPHVTPAPWAAARPFPSTSLCCCLVGLSRNHAWLAAPPQGLGQDPQLHSMGPGDPAVHFRA